MATKSNFPENDFTKLFADFKIPGVDFDALAQTQRRNLEALVAANQLAVEGVQAVTRRQAEILKTTMEEAVAAVQSAFDQTPPEQKLAKQAELAKVAFEKGLANARELAELVTKSNREAFELINKRVAQTIDELRDVIAKQTPAKR
jgi:phasin family protein